MNIAVREEENLLLSFSSYSFLGFLRFSSLDLNKKSASTTVNPRFRWDKVFFQIKGENFPNLT